MTDPKHDPRMAQEAEASVKLDGDTRRACNDPDCELEYGHEGPHKPDRMERMARETAGNIVRNPYVFSRLSDGKLRPFYDAVAPLILDALRHFEPLPCGHARSEGYDFRVENADSVLPVEFYKCRACERARAGFEAELANSYHTGFSEGKATGDVRAQAAAMEMRAQVVARLRSVGETYAAGGHTHRQRMLFALADEFAALVVSTDALDRLVAGAYQTMADEIRSQSWGKDPGDYDLDYWRNARGRELPKP